MLRTSGLTPLKYYNNTLGIPGRAEQAVSWASSRAEQGKMGAAPVHDVAREGFSLQVGGFTKISCCLTVLWCN